MCGCLCLTVALLALKPGFSRAESTSSADFQEALQALSEGTPSLAAQKLELLLSQNDPSMTGAEKERIILLLLEALVRSEKYQAALTLFTQYPALQSIKTARFWNAMALAESDQLTKATTILNELKSDPEFQYQSWVVLTLSRIRAKRAELKTALSILQPLLSSSDQETVVHAQLTGAGIHLQQGQVQEALALLKLHPIEDQIAPERKSFLLARIAMLQSDFPKAISHLEKLRKSEDPANRYIHQQAVLLIGDACLADGRKQEAITHYLHLIKHHPDDKFMPTAFEKLAESNAFDLAEVVQNLSQWSEEQTTHPERQAYAQYYAARTQIQFGHPAEARQHLENFITTHPAHLLYTPAALTLAELLIKQGEVDPAQVILLNLKQAALSSAKRSKALYLEALVGFEQGDFVKAENSFLAASEALGNSTPSETGTFNVALTALYAGDKKTFTQYQDLLKQSKNIDLQAELLIEQGLYQATHSITDAFDTLSLFLQELPDHSRAADAHFALAELYLNEIPAKPVSAREHLELASEYQLSPQQKETLDYIAVWIEETDDNYSAAIEQALLYLDHWPQSRRAPEIRLKLGAAYYQEKDFSQAIVALEQLAGNHPGSPLIGAALFSAGKAASLSMHPEDRTRAIELWARLAKNSDDPLALFARHEQGLYKLKLDEFDDALAAFDSILDADPPPPLDLKLAVLADRGQALFNVATSRNNEADLLENALRSFDSILSEPKVSPAWRNQAAVRKAKCLERLGRTDEALNTYTDIVQSDRLTQGTDTEATVAQMEWFFRAGLGAVRLLENKKEWHKAILIAESLANSGSSRAIEAARLADRIRLKHFIWDQPEK